LTSLDNLHKEEMRDIARKLDKFYSDEKFEKDWAEFIEMKRKKALN
jgi:hypothetical protein